MATTKRQINGEKHDVTELVLKAIETVDAQELDTADAILALNRMGHANPDEKLALRYARETKILAILASETGANFRDQIGKIDFSSNERAIAAVNAYLNRRNSGRKARWGAAHR